MGIIKITQEDINKSKPPDSGWHLFRIDKFTEEDSKDKKSKNWKWDMVIISKGTSEGRYGYARFNSKAPGMLVSSGFIGSALDAPIEAETDFDPLALIGKELWGNVKDEIYEGKPQKKTEEFAPASAPPF